MTVGIVWFRQDLRVADNRALNAAVQQCDQVLPLFIDDPAEHTISQVGAASRVWLHHSLASLNASLTELGAPLQLARGDALSVLEQVIDASQATRLFWNRCYDPATIQRDKRIKSGLSELKPATFNAMLVHEPWEALKRDGTPYRVFTPYWRHVASLIDEDSTKLDVLQPPEAIPGWQHPNRRDTHLPFVDLAALELLPRVPKAGTWDKAMMSHWSVGEEAAFEKVSSFVAGAVRDYGEARDLPAVEGTSQQSPHLHFGEISPRQILGELLHGRKLSSLSDDETTFAKEVVWREFAFTLLFHFPEMIDTPLDQRFTDFPWAADTDTALECWQSGHTGVPIVDAGMRQLYATGWMHNRVRMIVGSYLIKNLLIPWQSGEAWFRDTLVDADLASNSMGWQWCAGCGVDAAPFFRVFNPVLQGERFDKAGDYVRQWVPELAAVPSKFVHKPWELPDEERAALDYPEPLVDLKASRQRALDAFAAIRA